MVQYLNILRHSLIYLIVLFILTFFVTTFLADFKSVEMFWTTTKSEISPIILELTLSETKVPAS